MKTVYVFVRVILLVVILASMGLLFRFYFFEESMPDREQYLEQMAEYSFIVFIILIINYFRDKIPLFRSKR